MAKEKQKTTQVTSFRYDLHTTNDPYVRLGIQGLHRYLKYGKPNVEGFGWSAGDHSLTVNFSSWDVLRKVAQQAFQPNRYGLIVMPGYPEDPGDTSFYATMVSNQGVAGNKLFKPASTGQRRDATIKDIALRGIYAKHPYLIAERHQDFQWRFPKGDDGKQTYQIMYGFERQGLSLEGTPPFGAKEISITSLWSPAYSNWGNIPLKYPSDAPEPFALWFSPYGYLYFGLSSKEVQGIGMDLQSFTEADKKHALWMRRHKAPYRDLPQLAYLLVLQSLSLSLARPWYVLKETPKTSAVQELRVPRTNTMALLEKILSSISEAPVVDQETSTGVEVDQTLLDQMTTFQNWKIQFNGNEISILEAVYQNVCLGRHWTAQNGTSESVGGMLAYGEPLGHRAGLYSKDVGALIERLEGMNSTTEQFFFKVGANLVGAVFYANKNKAMGWQDAQEQVKNALRPARSYQQIQKAVVELGVVDPDSRFGLSDADFEIFTKEGRANPSMARSCLLMGCMRKWKAPEGTENQTSSEDENVIVDE